LRGAQPLPSRRAPFGNAAPPPCLHGQNAKMQGAVSFSAEQKIHGEKNSSQNIFYHKKLKSFFDFKVEILANFDFYVYLLAANSTSAVPSYGYVVEFAASASN